MKLTGIHRTFARVCHVERAYEKACDSFCGMCPLEETLCVMCGWATPMSKPNKQSPILPTEAHKSIAKHDI